MRITVHNSGHSNSKVTAQKNPGIKVGHLVLELSLKFSIRYLNDNFTKQNPRSEISRSIQRQFREYIDDQPHSQDYDTNWSQGKSRTYCVCKSKQTILLFSLFSPVKKMMSFQNMNYVLNLARYTTFWFSSLFSSLAKVVELTFWLGKQ